MRMKHMARLSNSVSHAIRMFAFWLANGTVGLPILQGIDYACIFSEPSALEQTFAIFANVLELDEKGEVVDGKRAELRAAQWIHSYCTGEPMDPPLEEWEQALY